MPADIPTRERDEEARGSGMSAVGQERGARRRRVAIAAVIVLLVVSVSPGRASPRSVPVRTAGAVRALAPDEAARGLAVRFDAVVTSFDPAWRLCFVQDRSAGIFVQLPSDATVATGEVLSIDGVSAPGDFAPVVKAWRLVCRGRAALPIAPRATISALLDGRFDSQWIETEGVVRRVSRDQFHIDVSRPARTADLAAALSRAAEMRGAAA
jgi:hypothetical protein